MKIPDTIKILGHDVKVRFPYYFKERTDLRGQYDGDSMEIRISDRDQSGNLRDESTILPVLIEEVLHAIDLLMGHRVFDTDNNHRALNGICEGLYQVLVDNNLVPQTDD